MERKKKLLLPLLAMENFHREREGERGERERRKNEREIKEKREGRRGRPFSRLKIFRRERGIAWKSLLAMENFRRPRNRKKEDVTRRKKREREEEEGEEGKERDRKEKRLRERKRSSPCGSLATEVISVAKRCEEREGEKQRRRKKRERESAERERGGFSSLHLSS